MKKIVILLGLAALCFSCSILKNPENIHNSIPIYENQTDIMDGVYFNRPYKNSYDYKTFLEIVNLNGKNVDSIGLSLLDSKHLEVTRYKPLGVEKNIVKGKLKKGTFQIKNKNFFFGIPYLFFFDTEEKTRISVGVLDEIIVQHYQYNYSQFFGNTSEEVHTDYYHYSKTLEVIP